MQLDYFSLGIAIGIVSVLSAVMMTVLYRINVTEKGLGCWVLAAILGAIGFLILPLLPSHGNTIILLNNIASLFAALFILEGILRFRNFGQPTSRRLPIVIIFLLIIFLVYSCHSNHIARYLLHDAVISVLLLLSVFFLLYRTSGLERIVHLVSSVTFLILTAGFMYRWHLVFSGRIGADYTNHPFMGVLFLLTIIWILGFTYGMGTAIYLRIQQKTLELATHDDLTGLDNRRSFYQTMEYLIKQSRHKNQKFILFIIDLNAFKMFNDTYGHAFGDEVLIVLADTLKKLIRETDLSVRLGGDEFVLVIKFAGKEDVKLLKERLRDSIERVRTVQGKQVYLKISIGVSVFPEDGLTLDELLAVADQRMYEDKNTGSLSVVEDHIGKKVI